MLDLYQMVVFSVVRVFCQMLLLQDPLCEVRAEFHVFGEIFPFLFFLLDSCGMMDEEVDGNCFIAWN